MNRKRKNWKPRFLPLLHIGNLLAALLLTVPLFLFSYYLYAHRSQISIIFFFLVYSGIILCIIAFICLSLREFGEKIDLEYLEMQRRTAVRQEESLLHSQEAMERQMREVKTYLGKMEHLLEEEKLEDARLLCGDFSSSFQATRYRHYCENDVLDVILHGKEMECTDLGITFSCQVLFPKKVQIATPVFISLFFNLLNNGIEGCVSSGNPAPFLRLSIDYKGDFLLVHMENSKNPDTVFTHTTTKADHFCHGLGLSILEDIVRKRDGSCSWRDLGDTFVSDLMLRYL